LEIHHIENQSNGIPTEGNNGPLHYHDEDAVRSFRRAFNMGEDHALLAFRLIKTHSPKEYEHWRMMEWM
jgi:hypothetical protein